MASPTAPVITPAFLDSLRTQPHLPLHSWYVVAAVTTSTLGRPSEVATVFTHAITTGAGPVPRKPSETEQTFIAKKLREALIRVVAVAGMPKTINSIFALKPHTPPHLREKPSTNTTLTTSRAKDLYETSVPDILARGDATFKKLYGPIAPSMIAGMDHSGCSDLGITTRLIYGYFFSNPELLSAAESSFMGIAAMIPQDVNAPLRGHLNGAVNNGATRAEVQAVRAIVIRICEAAGMKLLSAGEKGFGWKEEVAKL